MAAAEMSKMCKAALAGDLAQALMINERLMPLHKSLFVESNPIPVKWAAARLGLVATAELRLPLTTLGLDGQRKMDQAMSQAELLQRV